LGRLEEFLLEVLDLARQMAVAALNGAGDMVEAAVAIDHEIAGQPNLAEDLLGHASGPGLAEKE
jgi:hypothetical protein